MFLLASININILLDMFFFIFSDIDMQFTKKLFI